MSSSSNVMEVITKGRYEGSEGGLESSSCHSSSSHSVRTESQLSLEHLPPEAPCYGNGNNYLQAARDDSEIEFLDMTNTSTKEKIASTDQLFNRIQALSEQIHSELGTVHDVEWLRSYTATPNDDREDEDVLSTTLSSQASDRGLTDPNDQNNSESNPLQELAVSDLNECQELMCFSASQNEMETIDNGQRSATDWDLATLRVSSNSVSSDSRDSKDHLLCNEHLDPKLKKALDKMKKFDEKLADLDKREKEVKKQRKLLKRELELYSNESTRTSALSLDRGMYTPVFTTQLNDTAADGESVVGSTAGSNAEENRTEQGDSDPKAKSKRQDNVSGINFIKRNIELASDAGALVAMTEAEKKRLEQLLGDNLQLDKLNDSDPEQLKLSASDDDEGFVYQKEDLDKMKAIDSQLKAILPPHDWDSISYSSHSRAQTSSETYDEHESKDFGSLTPPTCEEESKHFVSLLPENREVNQTVLAHDYNGPGEEIRRQFQMSRGEKERLKNIDERLRVIQKENEMAMQGLEPLRLPAVDLQSLLDECRKEQASPDSDIQDIETDEGLGV